MSFQRRSQISGELLLDDEEIRRVFWNVYILLVSRTVAPVVDLELDLEWGRNARLRCFLTDDGSWLQSVQSHRGFDACDVHLEIAVSSNDDFKWPLV